MKRGREEEEFDAIEFFNDCELGKLDIVKDVIERGIDVVNVKDCYKRSALQFAALNGHVDVAKVLIQNGADVNAVNEDKETALHYAAWEGHVDVATLLIQNGVDVNAVDQWKRTALHNAICKWDEDSYDADTYEVA